MQTENTNQNPDAVLTAVDETAREPADKASDQAETAANEDQPDATAPSPIQPPAADAPQTTHDVDSVPTFLAYIRPGFWDSED